MSGGIAFGDLNDEQVFDFQVSWSTFCNVNFSLHTKSLPNHIIFSVLQENLIKTMIALEDTYFAMAAKYDQVLKMETRSSSSRVAFFLFYYDFIGGSSQSVCTRTRVICGL